MPAKPLNQEQLEDAARLLALFLEWQKARKKNKEPYTQDAVTDILEFGQSALSQYLNGGIPLNVEAAFKFSEMLERPISAFSPSLAEEATDKAARYARAAYPRTERVGVSIPDLACETTDEIGLLTAYRLAKKLNDLAILGSYDGITEELLRRLAAERKQV
jgi:transcriptional regulator with XRE-family HTH domain